MFPAVWCVLALLASACGASNGSPGTSGPAAVPSNGPLDKASVAQLIPTTAPDPSQAGALGAALVASDRAEVNAASGLGPVIATLQATQDADVAKALQELQAKQAAAAVPPGLATGAMEPVVFRPAAGPGTPRHPDALLSQMSTLVVVIVGTALDAYDPRTDSSPAALSTTVDDDTGGVSTNIQVTLTTAASGGRFSATLSVSGDTSKTDPSTGAVVGQVVGASSFDVSFDPCPDANGTVAGHLDVADDETDSGTSGSGSVSYGFSYKGSADFTVSVNDQAEIASTTINAEMDRALTTGPQPTDLDEKIDQTLTGGQSGPVDVALVNAEGPLTEADGRAAANAYVLAVVEPITFFAQAAKGIWQGGKCFELRPSPDGGDVGPGSQTKITVVVYHWVDKAEVKLPVKATLAGAKAVDPAGVDQTSPATFTFTAGQPNSTGDITYKVVSKRGIGERTSHFVVQSGLSVDITGTLVESTALGTYRLAIKATGIQVKANPDGTLAVSGTVNVSGTLTFTLEPCTGKINENIPVIGSGSVTGPEDAPVFRVLFGPGSTGSLGGRVTCTSPPLSVPANAGDFFGQWSSTLGAVDLPAAGGTVPKSGSTSGLLSRNAKGTFVAKPL
ncbi:MAG TPA: hypothetical protein VMH24_06735 [Candidatus Sulfotelmatobacter sp.]|nr:hypothetical protein [Candidatus Sulfotelmatobacter sp.]